MPDSPDIRRLPASGFRRTPWKNGGGVTIDIAGSYRPGAEPGGWAGVTWRFGRTRIERPAPFSDLSGLDRVLVVVDGRGLTLQGDDGRVLDAREPLRPVRFAGERPLASALDAGPVGVLNLMGDRASVSIGLDILSGGALDCPAGEVVVYAYADTASVRIGGEGHQIPAGDALRAWSGVTVRVEAASAPVAVASIRPR